MLAVTDLCFRRGHQLLLNKVGLNLTAGDCLHLQGTNGSGKTTLLRLLAGLLQPDSGHIAWKGLPTGHLDSSFGSDCLYIGHHNGLQESATVAENLAFYGTLMQQPLGRERLAQLLQEHQLVQIIDRPVKQLSQGQKRRVAMMRLYFSKAQLWLLDEPLVALDQAALERFGAHLNQHLRQGGMALMTSHQALPSLPALQTMVLGQ